MHTKMRGPGSVEPKEFSQEGDLAIFVSPLVKTGKIGLQDILGLVR